MPIVKGGVENSAVFNGKVEYAGVSYENNAISQTSMALGGNNTAGLKGYYFTYIDFNNKQIWLHDKQITSKTLGTLGGWTKNNTTDTNKCNYSNGDSIVIIADDRYYGELVNGSYEDGTIIAPQYNDIKITNVDGNIITVDRLPFTEDDIPTGLLTINHYDKCSVFCPSKQGVGPVDFGGLTIAEGLNTKAMEGASHSEGYNTQSIGKYSHTEGRNNTAYYIAHAEGDENLALGDYSHAEGRYNKSYSIGSHTEGRENTVYSNFGHAEGKLNVVVGWSSHAEGSDNIVYGSTSHVEGRYNQAMGQSSHAEGNTTKALGNFSHSEGRDTVAYGIESHAEGSATNAIGATSHAEGYKTYAYGENSHVEGEETITGDSNDSSKGKNAHAEGQYTKAIGNFSHAQNYRTEAFGAESHAEGSRTKAHGVTSHAEGYLTETYGENSHGEGEGTKTTNNNEHAQGQYNVSNLGKTIHSVGIGTSGSNRKNAHEITNDGKHYILGVGNYDGTNPSDASDVATCLPNMVNITYNALKQIRDTAQLVPGQQYRIIDYMTTVDMLQAQSAGHQFDIIVTADDVNILNEKARAIQHEGDTYFADSNLAAWEIWYCIDNDSERFWWATNANGKGVIYRMIDEFGNDCPYDFKNVKFEHPNDNDNDDTNYYYTFTDLVDNVISDMSIIQGRCYGNIIKGYIDNMNRLELNNIIFIDNGLGYCHSNTFGNNCYSNTFGNNCNSNTFGNYCHSNTFGNNCGSNTFGDGCCYNTFGYDCHFNPFGNYCDSNTFGNNCDSNTFGNNCDSNTFGDGCYYNTFGDRCSYNSFGNDCEYNRFGNSYFGNSFGYSCDDNSFGNGCSNNNLGNDLCSNTFGNDCDSNTFGNNCNQNSFGNGCSNNNLGNGCYGNSFGNYCSSNRFGNDCDYNSFGNGCYGNSFSTSTSDLKSYYRYIAIESGNRLINLNCTSTTSSNNYFQNVRIGLGVNNTDTSKTIDIATINSNYEIKVAKNSNGDIKIYCEADLIA